MQAGGKTPGLKLLTKMVLGSINHASIVPSHTTTGIDIQSGEHDSVTDARATMAVFLRYRKKWEEANRGVQQQRLARRKADNAPQSKHTDDASDGEVDAGQQLDDDF